MIYEYVCDKCRTKFDERKPMEERATATCPKCGNVAKKVFSIFNVTWQWVLDGLTHDRPRRSHDPYVE
jgi:putative FmdB family regulatory protein